MTSLCDVIAFLFQSQKSSYIVLNLLIMIIRIKKIFILKKSSYNHPCIPQITSSNYYAVVATSQLCDTVISYYVSSLV